MYLRRHWLSAIIISHVRVRFKTFRPLVSILIFQSANMDLDALTETDDVYLHVFHNKEILKSMYLAACTHCLVANVFKVVCSK